MIARRKLAVGAASLAAVAAISVPLGFTSGGGTIDVFVGSTPTPTATATATATPTATPGAGVANLWVDGSGTCTRQGTAAAYNSATACTSFATACSAASNGDLIRVKEGSYAAQTLTSSCAGTSGNRKTFDAENGATGCDRQMIVRVSNTSYTHNACPVNLTDEIRVQGAHDVTFKNMSTSDWINVDPGNASANARITFTNWHSLTFQVAGTDILLEDGESGGLWVCAAGNGGTSGPWGTEDTGRIGFAGNGNGSGILRVTIDGYLIHDSYDISGGTFGCGNGGGGPHADGLQINQGDTITIKNSQFWNLATSDIQSNSDYDGPYANLTYENNFFGQVYTAGNGAEMGTTSQSDCTGTFTQRYNTYDADAGTQVCGGGSATFLFEGNLVIDGTSATSGWDTAGASSTVRYNVFGSGSLGTNSKTCTASLTSTNSVLDGLHLNSGDTCAKDAGNPGSFPTDDIDGGTRSGTPDAGADEIGVP